MGQQTYSFQDIAATIKGPGGTVQCGAGSGVAEEGISIEMTEDKNTMVIGAGGQGQHNLHAGKSGRITIRCLKVSPTNAAMMTLYNFQTLSSAPHGSNEFTLTDFQRGDSITAVGGAFVKVPPNSFGKDGEMMEWAFDFIRIDHIFGVGSPTLVL